MIRGIVFTQKDGAKRFEMILHGILMQWFQRQQQRTTHEDLRREAEALKALQGISREKQKDGTPELLPTGDADRELLQLPCALVVKQPVLDLMKRYVEQAPWKPGAAIDAIDTVDFLDACRKIDDDAMSAEQLLAEHRKASEIEAPKPQLQLVDKGGAEKSASEAQPPVGE